MDLNTMHAMNADDNWRIVYGYDRKCDFYLSNVNWKMIEDFVRFTQTATKWTQIIGNPYYRGFMVPATDLTSVVRYG